MVVRNCVIQQGYVQIYRAEGRSAEGVVAGGKGSGAGGCNICWLPTWKRGSAAPEI